MFPHLATLEVPSTGEQRIKGPALMPRPTQHAFPKHYAKPKHRNIHFYFVDGNKEFGSKCKWIQRLNFIDVSAHARVCLEQLPTPIEIIVLPATTQWFSSICNLPCLPFVPFLGTVLTLPLSR